MHLSVKLYFQKFSETLEGNVTWMYLDVKGLVTTGKGNLINSVAAAQRLEWQFRATPGVIADAAAVEGEWNRIAHSPESRAMSQGGGGFYRRITTLDLTPKSLSRLFNDRLASLEAGLKTYNDAGKRPYANFDNWPADAQLGLLSLGWAMGSQFRWRNFQTACLAEDWDAAAQESHMSEVGNAPIWKRNIANYILFQNASIAQGSEYPADVLYYPTLLAGAPTAKQFEVLKEF
jgi:GH24 family phage-related lysozyme (muramidase)